MSAEYLTAFASIGTFVVIGVTAIAAIVQLRHIRAANQLTSMIHVRDRFRSDSIQQATRFVHDELPARLKDDQFRDELLAPDTDRRSHPELRIADLFEQVGADVKYGMIEASSLLDVGGMWIQNMWDRLYPVVALRRAGTGSNSMYENFEYLALLAGKFKEKHPDGNYPAAVPRLMPENDWKRLQGSTSRE